MSASKEDISYVDLFCEFLEAAVHQVLYQRDLYPKNIFVERKKFSIPVKKACQPWVMEYISKTITNIGSALKTVNNDIESVIIVINQNHKITEKFIFEIDSFSFQKALGTNDEFLVQLELSFVSSLLRLAVVSGEMKSPDRKSTEEDATSWWVELGTTQRGAMRLTSSLDWCVASSETHMTPRTSHASILPVMAVDVPIKFQIYIEQNS